MGDEERNATSRGGRRSIGERSKTNNLLSLLEGARGAIRANDPKKFETALRAVQVDEFFVPLDTVEGKPTTLHQIVHSSPSIHDFDAFIDVLLKVVFERQPELRNEAHPLVQWANVLDGQGHTAIHKAVSLLGMKPRRPNREAPFCLHVVRSLVALGADLWHQSLEGRTALEYLFDSEDRYQEDDPACRELWTYFQLQIRPEAGLMEAELLRMLKSCASFGFHTPLQALLALCPSGADECFVIACQEGKLRCLDVLLASKEPKLSRKVLTDGLQEACKHNRKEIVARLIDVADINAPSAQGWGCLQLACASGHAEVASMLLNKNANVQALPGTPHPLHLAARNGHISVLTLLARALPSDESDLDGRSALHYASAALCIPPELPGADWAAAETLLLRSINAFDDEGLTPLAYSLRRWAEQEGGKPEPEAVLRTVRYLLQKGANVDIKGESRRVNVSGALSAVEIAQERCNALRPELIVLIWKASRPSAAMSIASAPTAAEAPKSGKRAAESDIGHNASASGSNNGLPPDVKRIALTSPPVPSPALVRPSSAPSSASSLPVSPALVVAPRPVVASLAPAAIPPSPQSAARSLVPIPTLRFLEVVKDDTGAVVLPPEFLVSGAPDDLPCMPLAAVPSAHRHAAIALAVREGRLNDGQKKELYEIWRQANPGGG